MTRWLAVAGAVLGLLALGWLLARLMARPRDPSGGDVNRAGLPPEQLGG